MEERYVIEQWYMARWEPIVSFDADKKDEAIISLENWRNRFPTNKYQLVHRFEEVIG